MTQRRRFGPLSRRHPGTTSAPSPTREPGATATGVLDATVPVEVDAHGAVRTPTLTLRPWIGAEDRWHRLDDEVAVRQRLVADAPVVETLLRVPGGDVVWRVYGARPAGGGEAVVVELENLSHTPVALALVLEPNPVSELAFEGPAVWRAGAGAALLVAPRTPSFVAGAADLDALFELVVAEKAVEPGDDEAVAGHARQPVVAVLHPVTHGTTFTAVVPLSGPPPAAGALGGLPAADVVARGWRRQLGAAALVELPDVSWTAAVAATRAQLVLGAGAVVARGPVEPGTESPGGAAAVGAAVRALDGWGHHDEAAQLLVVLTAELATSHNPAVAASFLAALHGHWRATGDVELPRAAVDDLARSVALLDRALRRDHVDSPTRRARRSALAAAGDLLAAAGQVDAATAVRALAAEAVPTVPAPAPDEVDVLLRGASSTWTWPEPWLGARALLGVRAALVAEPPEGPIELLPGWRQAWRGTGLEVHGLPVGPHRLSYALRWHGERPALLWEMEVAAGTAPRLVFSAPALDPSWRAVTARGEALLEAPPLEPGDGGPPRVLDVEPEPGPTLAPPSTSPSADTPVDEAPVDEAPVDEGPDEFS